MTRLYPLPLCDDADSPGPLACRCLQVYEAELVEAIAAFDLRTMQDVRRVTGAGGGCTCCHARIRQYLGRHAQSLSDSPICSVR